MIESYTDEEVLETRQYWLDQIEKVFDQSYFGPTFYIVAKDFFIFFVDSDGGVGISNHEKESCTEEYLKLYPELKLEGSFFHLDYLSRTTSLKLHLTNLVEDPASKICDSYHKLTNIVKRRINNA